MRPQDRHSTWVEVNLNAVEDNIRRLVQITGVEVMLVMKANGYGHGALQVARAAIRGGATWLGTARAEEALALRAAGMQERILILGLTPVECLAEVIEAQISLMVWLPEHIRAAGEIAAQVGRRARAHLKVDTGMGRIGALPEQAIELARDLVQQPNLVFEGFCTHFARADEADPTPTDKQERTFRLVCDQLERGGLSPQVLHAANSAASLTRPSARFDLVRVGIAAYGLHPSPECRLPEGFSPALSWKSQLSQVKILPAGWGVSYGHRYLTKGPERIGTVTVGYADGFRRVPGNQVLVGGRRVEVVGRVSMDQIMVQLDELPGARPGDEVVLIGEQGQERITAEQVAETWGTVNYEVICGIGARVPRVYR